MSPAFKKLLIRALIFSIPFVAYGLLVVAVDPYNYFAVSDLIPTEQKGDISLKVNYAMWKVLRYREHPVPNILLGDSRMMSVDATRVSEVAGKPYFNMAYGGGSIREAVDSFWFATEQCRLESVYIGLNINTYNAGNTKDRISEALGALDNPLLYFTNYNVLIAGRHLLSAALTGQPKAIGKPTMDREAFWRHQLDVITRVYLSTYRYPTAYRDELREISEYCRENAIDLNFVLFPNHKDLQDKIVAYDLMESSEAMREDLRAMGRVFDFAFVNPLTENRGNYRDPYHFNERTMLEIVDNIWSKPGDIVRISGEATLDR